MIKKPNKAFSLIELSIVILIAAFGQGLELLQDSRLSAARTITQSSRAASLPSLVLWLETTNEKSFGNSEMQDESQISVWYDSNPQDREKNKAVQNNQTSRPVYISECINRLPCVSFDGVNDYMDTIVNLRSRGGLTIFVVISGNNFEDDQEDNSLESSIISSLSPDENVAWDDTEFNLKAYNKRAFYQQNTADIISSPIISNDRSHIINAIDNSAKATIYLDGVAGGTMNGVSTKFIQMLEIGAFPPSTFTQAGRIRYFKGGLAEILVFNKALSERDRIAVQSYLSKKWNIKLN